MPSMPYYRLEDVDFETHFRWIDECVKRGVYMLGYHNHFISLAHRNEDIDFIENTAKQAFQKLIKRVYSRRTFLKISGVLATLLAGGYIFAIQVLLKLSIFYLQQVMKN